jgi:hypothetical protein
MPNESAAPIPRIQLKYHIIRSFESSVSHVGQFISQTLQYIECPFSLSAAAVTFPRITRYTQLV